jgi:ATP-binding cassette subfamily F protein uup
MMDRVSTMVLGLDGLGHAERFADYSQWEPWQREQEARVAEESAPRAASETRTAAPVTKRKLSYIEAREFAAIEGRIAEAEETLQTKQAALHDPSIASDGPRLLAAATELEAAQSAVDSLYARWAELEAKQQ